MTAYIPGTDIIIATWDKLEQNTNHFTGLHIGSYYKSLFSRQKVKLIDAKTKLFNGVIQTTVKLDAGILARLKCQDGTSIFFMSVVYRRNKNKQHSHYNKKHYKGQIWKI